MCAGSKGVKPLPPARISNSKSKTFVPKTSMESAIEGFNKVPEIS